MYLMVELNVQFELMQRSMTLCKYQLEWNYSKCGYLSAAKHLLMQNYQCSMLPSSLYYYCI